MLGNLALDEARTFFLDYALPLFPRAPPVQHDTWKHVYSVCGGNPGQLNVCIAEAAARSSWEEGKPFRSLTCAPPQLARH